MTTQNLTFADSEAVEPSTPHQMWNDAVLVGDIESSEAQAVLSSEIDMLASARGQRTPGHKFAHLSLTVGRLLADNLTRHPEHPTKDGLALVYARGRKTGKAVTENGHRKEFASRLRDEVEAVTAVTIDVDGSAKIEDLVARLSERGLFAVVYTTHSHAAKSTPDGDRFRIVVFLDQPYELPDATDKTGRAEAVALWERKYTGFAESLGLTEIDGSGLRTQQIMFPPRRPKGAAFKHYIVAGRALTVEEMSEGDASKYRKSGPRIGSGAGISSGLVADGEPAVLSDGFDLWEWWFAGGWAIMTTSFICALGWEDRGDAGDGITIACPNDAAHSNAGDPDDGGCWTCELYGDNDWSIITCQHDHCDGLRTVDHLKLIGAMIDNGDFALPDDWSSFSAMLCDPVFYPDEIDGEEVSFDPAEFGAVEVIEVVRIGTAHTAKKLLKALDANENAGDEHFAALFAGVELAGNKSRALGVLESHFKQRFDGNKIKALRKLGKAKADEARKAWAAEQEADRRRQAVEAAGRSDLAHPSMDIADPLGDTLEKALATIGQRYALVDIEGKFRAVRKPNIITLRENAEQPLKSVIVASTVPDFVKFHEDRQVTEKDEKVNPAKMFVETQTRHSSLVFAPPPVKLWGSALNIYYGRTLEAEMGDASVIRSFLHEIVCGGREDIYNWVMLWLAHMVQFPGEKPGTAIVTHGEGGCGKSTLGELVMRLAAPHARLLENGEHVTGRFAGEHLSTCIAAVVAEAVFAGDPKVGSALKNLITATALPVEPKGLPVMFMPSYLRLLFDSNGEHVVPIEGNGSERRYLVLRISNERKGDKEYFDTLYAALNGAGLRAFAHELETFLPEDHGLTWGDVRVAPETEERRGMGYQSLGQSQREMLRLVETGQITLLYDGALETFKFDDDADIRLPVAALRAHLTKVGNSRKADDSDPEKLMHQMFGKEFEEGEGEVSRPVVAFGRGCITPGDGRDERWIKFPPRRVLLPELERRFSRQMFVDADDEEQPASAGEAKAA